MEGQSVAGTVRVAERDLVVETHEGLTERERVGLLAYVERVLADAVEQHGPCAIEPFSDCTDTDVLDVTHGAGVVARVHL